MNIIKKQRSSIIRALRLGASALLLCTAISSAAAKQRRPDPSQGVMVIAHVALDGKSTTDMSIQVQANGNRYLYVEHSPEQGVSILDIAKPSAPKVVGSVAWPQATTTHVTAVIGEALLLGNAETNQMIRSATQPSDETLVLWDTSVPNKPKVVRRFTNVNRVVSDDRGYIYLLNSDGVWVISTPSANRNGDLGTIQNNLDYSTGG